MTPHELIAEAICVAFYGHGRDEATVDRLQQTGEVADAVIDALEKMEVTDKMSMACRENDQTSWGIWQAMVGAMRDE